MRAARALPASLAALLLLAAGSPAEAGGGEWSIEVQALQMEVYGQDQHVLTVHEIGRDGASQVDNKRAVNLETDSGLASRAEFQYQRGQWGLGVDFFWFTTGQGLPARTAAADGPGGAVDEVVFEVADRGFSSSGPGEVLYYRTLADTDITAWTVDLYALRVLAEKPDSSLSLRFGLKVGDFDNDYRAVVGVEGVGGRRLDASSNYDRMNGLLVGLQGSVQRGRNRIEAYLGQAVLLGSVELTSFAREFTGPFSEEVPFGAQEILRSQRDIAIPISELRFQWSYDLGKHVSLGLGADAAAWWDVAVPPGVIPIADGDEALHENTLVFLGVGAAVKVKF